MIAIIFKNDSAIIFAKISSLKYFGAILLLAFVVQTFSKTFIVADYFANTATYASNCENKARPQMRCNGKCQMMKKLKQEENKDKQNPDRKTDNKEEVLSSKSFFASLTVTVKHFNTVYPAISGAKTVSMPRAFFHPPGFTA